MNCTNSRDAAVTNKNIKSRLNRHPI